MIPSQQWRLFIFRWTLCSRLSCSTDLSCVWVCGRVGATHACACVDTWMWMRMRFLRAPPARPPAFCPHGLSSLSLSFASSHLVAGPPSSRSCSLLMPLCSAAEREWTLPLRCLCAGRVGGGASADEHRLAGSGAPGGSHQAQQLGAAAGVGWPRGGSGGPPQTVSRSCLPLLLWGSGVCAPEHPRS